ncbi:MAG: UbiA prenyltransferase family protein, partial [Saprospiraceae bacterium]|nr:UbiA prenyltransferase family protein [Saprospiraceae bacterium]
MTIRSLLQLIRIEHWVKNLFVLLPAFFAARLDEGTLMQRAGLGFLAFSLFASAVYVLNDLVDAPQDRHHPDKRFRPLASGVVRRPAAWMLMGLLLTGGAALAYWLTPALLLLCLMYVAINVLYSFSLKHIALVDISLIGMGFLLRVLAGGAVTGVAVSHWLIVMTFLLALILGLAKRRGEYIVA